MNKTETTDDTKNLRMLEVRRDSGLNIDVSKNEHVRSEYGTLPNRSMLTCSDCELLKNLAPLRRRSERHLCVVITLMVGCDYYRIMIIGHQWCRRGNVH